MFSSGEVKGVVDFRDEELVLVRSFEDEAAEADDRSGCFPDDDGEVTEGDLGFRDVAAEMEGAVWNGRREAALVSVALVETTRLAGSAIGRVLGRRGDFEVTFVKGLVTFLTSFGSPGSVSARRKSVPILGAGEVGFFEVLATVVALVGFLGGGENTFGLDGAVLLGEGMLDRVDADLRMTGGDLTFGLRTTPETVRLRAGVGSGDPLDLADKAETGDLAETGCEDGRRCGVVLALWSRWVSGFRRACLDEDSEAGVNDFALTCYLAWIWLNATKNTPEPQGIRYDCQSH